MSVASLEAARLVRARQRAGEAAIEAIRRGEGLIAIGRCEFCQSIVTERLANSQTTEQENRPCGCNAGITGLNVVDVRRLPS